MSRTVAYSEFFAAVHFLFPVTIVQMMTKSGDLELATNGTYK